MSAKLILCSMSLSRAPIIQNSHILAEIYFIFLQKHLRRNWKCFNTNFRPQWKDLKSSCQVTLNLPLFCNLVFLNLGRIFVKALELSKLWKNEIWGDLGWVRTKKLFADRTISKIFETNCSFHLKCFLEVLSKFSYRE